MVSSLRRGLAVAALLLAMPLWAAEPVRIGVLAFRPKPQTLAQWLPLATALKRRMPDRDFVIEPLDYLEVGEAVASRRIDFVLTNPGHYVFLAHRSGLSSPLASLVNEEYGRPLYAYGGVIFTLAKRTDIESLEDLPGKKVAVVTDDALAGYQMQAYELAIRGIPLPRSSNLVKTGMPHDRTVEAVLNGQAEVGFARSGVLEAMVREGKLDMAQLRILNKQDMPGLPWVLSTRLYPEWPFAALPHTDDRLARNVAAVLFTLDRDRELMRRMKISGFTIPNDYAAISELLRELRLPPFEHVPRFTVADVLKKYLWESVVAMTLLGLVVLLAFRLMLTNRNLRTAKRMLAGSEQHYRLLVEHMRDVVWILDPETLRFLYVSPSVERLRGYTAEEVMSEPVDAALTPEFAAGLRQVIRERIADFESGAGKDEAYATEVLQPCKDGTMVWTEAITRYYRNETTGKIEIHGVTRDISERKQAELALQQSEAYNKLLFADSRLAMVVMDPETYRYTDCNQAAVEIYGLPDRAAVIGLTPYDVSDATQYDGTDSAVAARGIIEQVVATGSVVFEWRHRRPDGKVWDAKAHLMRMQQGDKTFLLFTLEDITEQKRVRDELTSKTEALQRSNADLERFAYSVSHDMRQPLRAVSGHLQLLQRSLKDKLDEQERENLGFALDGAKRMDSMIVSLLDYSRVGRKTEAKAWQSSRAALDEALGFLDPLIHEVSTELSVGGDWPQVYASRDELVRLFQNLIGNGIKFCEPGTPPHIEVESAVDGGIWRVMVRDHGIGIDSAQSGRLFQFFSRLQSRARYDGTGMGLALCRRIVEHHGGRIWVESEGEGRGSVFVFELPLEAENAVPSGS